MGDGGIDPIAFAAAFKQFLDSFEQVLPPPPSGVRDLVAAHFGADPAGMPSLTEQLHVSEHANLQLALEAILAGTEGWQLIGLPSEMLHYGEFSLPSVLAGRFHGPSE